jgi:1-deoxy-D-xylulose-5-phosphate reductoisomerase
VGKTLPAVLNAANEVAVNAFLERKISFTAIARIVEMAMEAHSIHANPQLSDILVADQEARQKAAELVARM